MKNIVIAAYVAAGIVMPFLCAAQSANANIAPNCIPQGNTDPGTNVKATKTTAPDVRLLARVKLYYDTIFLPYDSTTFSYSSGYGGFFDDFSLAWQWQSDIVHSYDIDLLTSVTTPDTKTAFTYGANNKVATRVQQQWNAATSGWDNRLKTTLSYDMSDNLITEHVQKWSAAASAWEDTMRTINTYTATNNIATSTREKWNTTSAAWVNFSRTIYTWDASDNLIVDLYQQWYSSTSAWADWYKKTNTYDISGNRTEQLNEQWSSTGLYWYPISKIMSSNFVAFHQPQTIIHLELNTTTSTLENAKRENYTYNSYNKPGYHYVEWWDVVSGTWEIMTTSQATRYYYETYTPASVDAPALANAGFDLYPNPASDNLTINASWVDATAASVAILDVNGKVFMTWDVPAKKQYTETFSVSMLPAGTYVVTLQSRHGAVSRKFSVVR